MWYFYHSKALTDVRNRLFGSFPHDEKESYERWISSASFDLCKRVLNLAIIPLELPAHQQWYDNLLSQKTVSHPIESRLAMVPQREFGDFWIQSICLLDVALREILGITEKSPHEDAMTLQHVPECILNIVVDFPQLWFRANLNNGAYCCYTPQPEFIELNKSVSRKRQRFDRQESGGSISCYCSDVEMASDVIAFVKYARTNYTLIADDAPEEPWKNCEMFLELAYYWCRRELDEKTLAHNRNAFLDCKRDLYHQLDFMSRDIDDMYEICKRDSKSESKRLLLWISRVNSRKSKGFIPVNFSCTSVADLILSLEHDGLCYTGARLREAISGKSQMYYTAYQMDECVSIVQCAMSMASIFSRDLDYMLVEDGKNRANIVCTQETMVLIILRLCVHEKHGAPHWYLIARYYLANATNVKFAHALLNFAAHMISRKFASKYCIEPNSSSIGISAMILDLIRRSSAGFNWNSYFHYIVNSGDDSWILSALKVAICIDRSEFIIIDEATLSDLKQHDSSRWRNISTKSVLPNAIDVCNAIIHSTTHWIKPEEKIKAIAGLKIKKDRVTRFNGSCGRVPNFLDIPCIESGKIGNMCAFKSVDPSSRTTLENQQQKSSVKTSETLTRHRENRVDIMMIGTLVAKIERRTAKIQWNTLARDAIVNTLSDISFVSINHFFYVPPPSELCQNAEDDYMIRQLVRFCGGAPIPPPIGVCRSCPFSEIISNAFDEKRKTTLPDDAHHAGL